MNDSLSQAAAALGKKGGSAVSEKKAHASRMNGAKGGRPGRPPALIYLVADREWRCETPDGKTEDFLNQRAAVMHARSLGHPVKRRKDLDRAAARDRRRAMDQEDT